MVVAHVAESEQIFFGVLAPLDVLFAMVQFKMTGIVLGPLVSSPAAALAGVVVANEYSSAGCVGNGAVVGGKLARAFQDIHTGFQVGSTVPVCEDLPAFLRPQLPGTPRPF